MTIQKLHECDVCNIVDTDFTKVKRKWIKVQAFDPNYGHKNQYSFFKGSKFYDVCSSECLQWLTDEMEAEESNVV